MENPSHRIEVAVEQTKQLQEAFANLTAAFMEWNALEEAARQLLNVPDEPGWALNEDATAFVKQSVHDDKTEAMAVALTARADAAPAPSQKHFCCDPGDVH